VRRPDAARADDEGELMQKVAEHAREAHGMRSVPPEIAEKVKEAVRDE
jgi:predicted small metal-binding protein